MMIQITLKHRGNATSKGLKRCVGNIINKKIVKQIKNFEAQSFCFTFRLKLEKNVRDRYRRKDFDQGVL